MLRLFVCKSCNHIFPDLSKENTDCPKCGKPAIPTEYFMIDLAKNNAELTREIYRQYGIKYEEFTDMMGRVDRQDHKTRVWFIKLRHIASGTGNKIKGIFVMVRRIFK